MTVEWPFRHRAIAFINGCRIATIFVSTVDHRSIWLTSFPKKAPKIRTGLPSLATCTLVGKFSQFPVEWYVSATLCLYSEEPIGIISVFCRLNHTFAAEHQVSRIDWSTAKSSSDETYMVMSSANRVALSTSPVHGIPRHVRSECQIIAERGSMARSNNKEERGSPWRTPR